MNYNFDEIMNRKGTYSTQWDFIVDRFGTNDILPFSISDTDFKIPTPVYNAIKKACDMQIFGYTRWNHDDYKNAIISYYQRRFQTTIHPNWIVYCPSVMYALSSLIELLTNPYDDVCTFAPMYTDFEDCTLIRNRHMIRVYLNEDYSINFSSLEEAFKTSKLFLFCSPHNPTGRVWRKEELDQIVSLAKLYDVHIVTDEIHMDIVLSGKHIPIMNYIDEYENIYSISSGSKTFNYPSLGGSYAFIPNPKIQEQFLNHTKHRDFVNSANFMGMVALMSSYTDCDDYVDQLTSYIDSNMDLVKEFIDKNCPGLSFVKPEGTYLAWINCKGLNKTANQIQEALIKVGKVGIMKGETYFGDGYLRMNVGCPKSKVLQGLEGLKKAVDYLNQQ